MATGRAALRRTKTSWPHYRRRSSQSLASQPKGTPVILSATVSTTLNEATTTSIVQASPASQNQANASLSSGVKTGRAVGFVVLGPIMIALAMLFFPTQSTQSGRQGEVCTSRGVGGKEANASDHTRDKPNHHVDDHANPYERMRVETMIKLLLRKNSLEGRYPVAGMKGGQSCQLKPLYRDLGRAYTKQWTLRLREGSVFWIYTVSRDKNLFC